MQTFTMLSARRLLSPDGSEGGGAQEGADAAGSEGGEGEAAAAAPQFVTRADFDALSSRLDERFPRDEGGRRSEERSQRSEDRAPKAPEKPDATKFNFNANNPNRMAELDRYNREVYRYHRHLDRQEEAQETQRTQASERLENTEKGHRARVSEYKKAHPEFETDLKQAGILRVLDEVKSAIFSHRNSAAIVHYLAKNKGAIEDLNESEDVQEVMFKVGALAGRISSDEEARKKNIEAAGGRPLRFSSRGSAGGGKKETSKSERFERFHK
jgi:hypothetical protein